MAKPKRIPYAANALLDETKMAQAAAIHNLLPLIRCNDLTPEERVSLPAQALEHIHNAQQCIDRIKQLCCES